MSKVYLLSDRLWFPSPIKAAKDGLIAIGGDLEPERLLLAYRTGIFPWYSDDQPIMWWSPDPRTILYPEDIRITRSIRQRIRNKDVEIRVDTAFEDIISNCSSAGTRQLEGTWITKQMQEAYIKLHHLGFAHSVETYYSGVLAGGLYGVSVGRMFCGESMFHLRPDASGIALVYLARLVQKLGLLFIDAQQESDHLVRMGARNIPRNDFIAMVKTASHNEALAGKWDQHSECKEIINSIVQ